MNEPLWVLLGVAVFWTICWAISIYLVQEFDGSFTVKDLVECGMMGIFAPLVAVVGICCTISEWYEKNQDRPLFERKERKQIDDPPNRGDWS